MANCTTPPLANGSTSEETSAGPLRSPHGPSTRAGSGRLRWPLTRGPLRPLPVERGVVLTSPVDPGYGIQVVRRVELDPAQPIMRIATEFRKLSGAPVTVGIWTITQMSEPERVCIQLPEDFEVRLRLHPHAGGGTGRLEGRRTPALALDAMLGSR